MSARTTSRSTKTGRRSSAKTVLERLTGAEAHTRRCCLVCSGREHECSLRHTLGPFTLPSEDAAARPSRINIRFAAHAARP
jgi:hypothetical protein